MEQSSSQMEQETLEIHEEEVQEPNFLLASLRTQSENYNNRNVLNQQYSSHVLQDMLKNDGSFSPKNQLQNH